MAKQKKTSKKKKKFLTKLVILAVVLVVLLAIFLFVTPTESDVVANTLTASDIPGLELPEPLSGMQIVEHTGYTLSYNEEYEVPNYVAYVLTKDKVMGGGSRKDNFRADPAITTGSATLDDYKGTGYDRGHLAPAADFKWSGEAMSDTFYLSNMAPQKPEFNRGIWGDLEAVVRQNAYDNEKLYVVTGPVLTDGPYETIGKNNIAVPKQYYKVLLDYTEPEIKAIGFILPSEGSSEPLQNFACSVADIQELTGINFFPSLPDDQEELIEGTFDVNQWSWTPFNPQTATGEKTYIEPAQKSAQSEVKTQIYVVLYEIKKEIISYLGLTKIAKQFNIL